MKNFIMMLFDELQFEMNPIICEDDNCPYQNYCEELLDEHNLTVCDIIEDFKEIKPLSSMQTAFVEQCMSPFRPYL